MRVFPPHLRGTPAVLTPLRSTSTAKLVEGGSTDDVVGLVTHAGTCSASIGTLSDALQRSIAARDPQATLRGLASLTTAGVALGQATTALRAVLREGGLPAGIDATALGTLVSGFEKTVAMAELVVQHGRHALGAPTVPATMSAATSTSASMVDGYARERRLQELVLGTTHATHVLTSSSPRTAPTGPKKPHEVRLAASGMLSRTAVSLGDKPVLPPRAGDNGTAIRTAHPIPAWDAREVFNRPFLEPGRVFSQNDAFDFQLFRNSKTAAAAMAELAHALVPPGQRVTVPADVVVRGPPRNVESLSPPARFLAELIRFGGSVGGMPATLHGTLQSAVVKLFAAYGEHFQLDEATAASHIGERNAGLLFSMLRECVPERRGLQQVLHRSTLPMEPVDARTPLTREEAAALLADAPDQLRLMMERAPIPQTLRALEAAAPLIKGDAFRDVHIVAVQHVLSTNATMFQALEKKGADPARVEIVGIPYSTNYVVENVLRARGYRIDTPLVVDPNDITAAYERAVEEALARAVARAEQDGRPILLIDDGGKASAVAARRYPHLAHLFRAVEQTTRGLTELHTIETERGGPMPFPVVDVAKSPLKAHEMPKIGAQVVGEIDTLTALIGLSVIDGKDVTVTGFGPIGRGVALALRERGARVTIWDKDPAVRARAIADGFFSPDDRVQALHRKALIVGATGHRSITRDDMVHLSHECVLASASSRDVEIDLSVNRDADVETVPLLTAGRGDRRFVTRVWRFGNDDGAKDIVVLKNGFPLNFNGDYETGTPEDIEQTRAIMLMGAAQAVDGLIGEPTKLAAGITPLSLGAQRAFATTFGIPPP